MAVLHRLDKRCDQAAENGARHLAILGRWNDWLQLVGSGEESSAFQQLETAESQDAQHCQHCQLSLGESPTVPRPTTLAEWARLHPLANSNDGAEDEEEADLSHHCWRDEEGNWMTDFPPPDGFDGFRIGIWGDRNYERGCTAEETALLEADEEMREAADRADAAEERDRWFDLLRQEQTQVDAVETDPPSVPDQLRVAPDEAAQPGVDLRLAGLGQETRDRQADDAHPDLE
jgi:hypothetical protein